MTAEELRGTSKAPTRPQALLVGAALTSDSMVAGIGEEFGLQPVLLRSGTDALRALAHGVPALLLVDIGLDDIPARLIVRQAHEQSPQLPIIVAGHQFDTSAVVEVMRRGACDVAQLADPDDVRRAIAARLPSLLEIGREAGTRGEDTARLEFFAHYEKIFRFSEAMRALERRLVEIAATDVPVLVRGEVGTGKPLVARAVHYLSGRASRPVCGINLSTLPPEAAEVELFGEEATPGLLERANGGTVIVGEVLDASAGLQARIVRLLEEGVATRLRSPTPRRVDVRIVATSVRNLEPSASSGGFRKDLLLRLDALSVVVPPLRECREDIPHLLDHFRDIFARQFGRPAPTPSPETLELMRRYDWPYNVEELENLVKRWVVLGSEALLQEELLARLNARAAGRPAMSADAQANLTLGLREIGRRAARTAEAAALREALERSNWNRAAAARLLKVSYKTLQQKLEETGLLRILLDRQGT